jgi:hypothetical protein
MGRCGSSGRALPQFVDPIHSPGHSYGTVNTFSYLKKTPLPATPARWRRDRATRAHELAAD